MDNRHLRFKRRCSAVAKFTDFWCSTYVGFLSFLGIDVQAANENARINIELTRSPSPSPQSSFPDLLFRIFCKPGSTDSVITTPPTYGMYAVCACVNDVTTIKVPLTPDFDLRVDDMLDAVTPTTKLMFVCSPGNPTSKLIPLADVERLASSPKYNGIIIVDEAYIDFSSPESSAVTLLSKYDNIVVLQTLSKAFGLAGARCGFAVSKNEEIIQLMNNVKAPYNLSSLASERAIIALNNTDVLAKNLEMIMSERERVKNELIKIPFVVRVCVSHSNFLLFELTDKAQEVYKYMADNGVVCRYKGSEMHCKGCLRVTVGTPNENNQFLEGLRVGFKAMGGKV